MLDVPALVETASAAPSNTTALGARTPIMAHLTSGTSIFLPRYSGERPTISPARNTVNRTTSNMPYSPAPTPPKMTSPKQDVEQRCAARERRKAVVHRVHRAVRGERGGHTPKHGIHYAIALFLALHERGVRKQGVAVILRPQRTAECDEKNQGHRRENGHAMSPRAGHQSKHPNLRAWQQQDGEHFEEVGQRCRIFERMRAVRAKKSTAICADLFNGDL